MKKRKRGHRIEQDSGLEEMGGERSAQRGKGKVERNEEDGRRRRGREQSQF